MKTEAIPLEYQLSPAIMKQASVAWTKEAPFAKRIVGRFWRIVLWLVGINFILFGALRFFHGPDYTDAHFDGAILGIVTGCIGMMIFVRLMNNQIQKKAKDYVAGLGAISLTLSEEGTRFIEAHGFSQQTWGAYEAIIAVKGATVLRAGAMQYPIPNDALPEGLTPEAFRAQLQEWKDATCEEQQ